MNQRNIKFFFAQTGASTVSTLQILSVCLMLIFVFIIIAWLFVPEQSVAPPTSRLSYESPPSRPPALSPAIEYFHDEVSPPVNQVTIEEYFSGPQEDTEQIAYNIVLQGMVQDDDTNEPVVDVLIQVQVILTDGEIHEFSPINPIITVFRTKTDASGKYNISLPMIGRYSASFIHQNYVTEHREFSVSDKDTTLVHNIRLHQGAKISGRITEEGSGLGAANLTVVVQDANKNTLSDEDGYYELSGFEPGEFSIYVDLKNAPYQTGRELPFQRIRINQPGESIRNVNFRVAPAGLVWGYVTTPDEEPAQADVILASSESFVSQVLNMSIRQQTPLITSTDIHGYYELGGVPLNEQWRIHATSRNDAQAPQLSDPFMLNINHREARIDIFLFPGSTIRGVVRDTRRNLIENAEVICFPAFSQLLGPMNSAQAFTSATTDENGYFEIQQVPAGSYQLYTFKEGFKYTTTGQHIYPNGYSDIEGVTLILIPQDEGRYKIYGTVTNVNKQPILAQVSLAGISTESISSLERSTNTDAQGGYLFDGIESGIYQLTVSSEGYATRTISNVRLNQPNEITLQTASLIRGQVLVRQSNQPPDYYSVSAHQIASMGSIFGRIESEIGQRGWSGSDPTGRFEISIAAGEYRLEAMASNYVPARIDVSVEAGEVVDGITLYLQDSGGAIAGRVITRDGSSPQGARVALIESDTANQALAMLAVDSNDNIQQVGADGMFEYTMLPTGTYIVMAQHQNYAPASYGPIDLDASDTIRNIEILLGAGGALEGYVYKDGRPVTGAMVIVLASGQPYTATTESDGYYYLDGLSTGSHQAIFSTSDASDIMGLFNTQGAIVDIEDGRVTRHDFGTGEGTRIEGMCSPSPSSFIGGRAVLRQPGFPAANLGDYVNIDQVMGNSTGINSAGLFEFDSVPAGDWQLDIYYFEASVSIMSSLRYVHTEIFTVTHEDTIINLDIALSVY